MVHQEYLTTMELRKIVIEVDFINKTVTPNIEIDVVGTSYSNRNAKKTTLDDDLTEKFLVESVDDFWHNDNDKMDFFQYFDDGTYFCQRQKRQYDFKTESSYYKTYSFTGATSAQAKEFCDLCTTFFEVGVEMRNLEVEKVVKDVDKEVVFYEQRWYKIRRQKTEMLNLSDWRVLPDIEEEYEGERDRWIQWRRWIRKESMVKPTDDRFNGSGLEYFKYTYEMKWPRDPNYYLKLYPNGKLEDGVTDAPAYMDVDDAKQWVKHDAEASSDFMKSREDQMYLLANKHKLTNRKISNKMKEMMVLLGVPDRIPDDWDRYYTSDSELEE